MSALELVLRQPWMARLGWTLVHFLWQGTAIAAAYAAARGIGGRFLSARGRYALACAAMAAMAAAPPITFLAARVAVAAHAGWQITPGPAWEPALPWLVLVWVLGVALFSARLIGGWRVVMRLRRVAVAPPPAEWRDALDALMARMRVSAPVRLLVSSLAPVPMVLGWLRPVILAPVGMLTGVPADQVRALLAHELAHVLRRDYLVNILQSVAEAALFYHPAVWWISERIRVEREACCDDMAVEVTGDPLIYASALADLDSRRRARLRLATAADGGSLVSRIRRLLGHAEPVSHALPGFAAGWAMSLLWLAGLGAVMAQGAHSPVVERRAFVPPAAAAAPATFRIAPPPPVAMPLARALLFDPFFAMPLPQTAPADADEQLASVSGVIMTTSGTPVSQAQVILLTAAPPAPGAAAQPLSGVVKDPSGALVSGAAVSLQRLPRATAVQTTTDAQGRFRFAAAAPGSYTVSVTKNGFEPWERAVTVADKPIDLGVSLKLKVLAQTVQVSGKRSPLANSDPNYKALRSGKLIKVYRVNNLALQRDVGAFTFRSGSFSFLPPVLGQVVVGVFVGDGAFQLKPAFDLAVKHLRRIAGTDSVNEDFTAMVVYFSDSTFDEIKQRSELADESPERHEAAFRRVKNILEQRREPTLCRDCHRLTQLERMLNYEDIPNYDAEILAELYNPAQRGSFRAFLHGRKHDDLRFLLNPRGAMPMLAAPEETALLNFDPNSESDGIWYLSHLASELQSGRASSKEDKRSIAPEHYQIQVFLGRPNLLGTQPDMQATCDLRFRALDDGVRMVKFDLVPDLQVSRVAWNGKDIPFIQEGRGKDGSFYLQMPEPLVKGHDYQVTFDYSGGEIVQSQFGPVPPRRIWYPTPAGPASRATYDLTFHVPRGMTIVSVGKQVNETREGAFDVTEWSCDVPISQAVFRYLGEFSGATTTEKTTNIQLAAYVAPGRGISESANDVLTDTGNSVRVFTNWFGPPAYNNLSVVEGSAIDSLPGLVYTSPSVMAGWSSLVTLTLALTRGRDGGPPRRMRTFLDEAFSRQVSGQWWGNTVAPASFHDAWLSAGFANFSTSLYDLAAYLNLEEYRDHWVKAREAILVTSRYGVLNDIGPLWMGVLNDTYKTPTTSMVLNTSKGGYILQMLRSMMWDPQTQDADFRAMMQDYVKQFANQAVSTEDFQSLVEKHMKRPMDMDGNHRMDWFFSEWVYGTGVPSYRLEYSLAAESGGKRLLTGRLTQSGVLPGFKMIVPLFAELAGQKVRVAVMAMRGNSTRDVKVMLPQAPKQILLNVNHDVLTDKEEVKLVK